MEAELNKFVLRTEHAELEIQKLLKELEFLEKEHAGTEKRGEMRQSLKEDANKCIEGKHLFNQNGQFLVNLICDQKSYLLL